MELKVAQADENSVGAICEELFSKKGSVKVRVKPDDMKRTFKFLLQLDEEERVILTPEK